MFILHRLLAVGFSLAFATSVLAAPNRLLVPRRPGNVPGYVWRFNHHHHRHPRRHHVHRRVLPIQPRIAVPTVRRHLKYVPPRHRRVHRHHRR